MLEGNHPLNQSTVELTAVTDAAQLQILQLQQQMHEANQARLQKMEAAQERDGKILQQISLDVAGMRHIPDRVNKLEKAHERRKGAMAVIGSLSTLGGGIAEYFLHKLLLR